MSVWFSEAVGRRSHRRWRPTEPPSRKHNRDRNECTVQLRLVHARNGELGVAWLRIQDVGDATVGHELLVHRHLQLLNLPVRAEDFAQVAHVHVLGELLNHDFGAARYVGTSAARWAPGVGAVTFAAAAGEAP